MTMAAKKPPIEDPKSESRVQAEIRLSAVEHELQLFRNNVGVLVDATGRPVRYGLANESKELNKKIKSGDLIGWRPIFITEDMVGKTIAQFVSIECKSQKKHARVKSAQRRWAQLVQRAGGLALILSRRIEAADLDSKPDYSGPDDGGDDAK
jgi:hypothetical protein